MVPTCRTGCSARKRSMTASRSASSVAPCGAFWAWRPRSPMWVTSNPRSLAIRPWWSPAPLKAFRAGSTAARTVAPWCAAKSAAMPPATPACTTSGALRPMATCRVCRFAGAKRAWWACPRTSSPKNTTCTSCAWTATRGCCLPPSAAKPHHCLTTWAPRCAHGSTASSTSPSSTWAARGSTPSRTGSCTSRT
ncbi:hypothetical protein D3C71_1484690 [compost metagenome]